MRALKSSLGLNDASIKRVSRLHAQMMAISEGIFLARSLRELKKKIKDDDRIVFLKYRALMGFQDNIA